MKISALLKRHFGLMPTASQQLFFERFDQFIFSEAKRKCFVLRGYAGTGKTTCLKVLVDVLPVLRMNFVLLAPTGRAAKVMSHYTGKNAFTIHKRIYRKKAAVEPFSGFVLGPNRMKKTIFMVDEASMISDDVNDFGKNSLLEDLVQFVYQSESCSLLLVGDAAQLPPVGTEQSRALNQKYLASKFDLQLFDSTLQEVVRQSARSGILYNATQIRKQLTTQNQVYPSFVLNKFKDVYKMTGEKFIEGLEYAYRKFGEDNTLIICRSNKSANLFNQNVRNRVLYREEELNGGDLVMIVKNNYFWLDADEGFIANGDIALIDRVLRKEQKYGMNFADVRLTFVDDPSKGTLDCKVLLDSILCEKSQLYFEDLNAMYLEIKESYADVRSKSEWMDKLKNDPYYNAIQIKFAYAVTCHKAQGGQWDAVFVDQGYLTDEMMNTEFLRWMYTAITRAAKELFLVNFSHKFFPAAENDLDNW